MKTRLQIAIISVFVILAYGVSANKSKKEEKRLRLMEKTALSLPDSIFEDVVTEDLLDDEVYLKLARDGWTPIEISRIMETAVKDKKQAKKHAGYGAYAKEFRPAFGRTLSEDPLYQLVDSGLSRQAVASIYATVGETDYNTIWKSEPYDAEAHRSAGYTRRPGFFRPLLQNPSAGRIKWIAVNNHDGEDADPEGNCLYVIADGAGIFRTDDCGKSWTCITDNIPDRANRGISAEYSLPIDPDDWNHIIALMQNNSVYESFDGGKSWRNVQGAGYNNKTFKRGYAFRAKPKNGETQGTLKLIGAAMNNSNRMFNELWLSDDKGVTWKQFTVPEDLKETVTINGKQSTGFWFQQMAFDLDDRDIVYFPGCRSILYFDDAGASGTLKQMTFNVYKSVISEDSVRLRNTTQFPFKGNAAGHMEIDPNNPNRMWYTVGNSTSNCTALYYSADKGKNWITLHEPSKDYNDDKYSRGSGTVFGNETANSWLGGFGIQYNAKNPDEVPSVFFGCSMSSAWSVNGTNFSEYSWTIRQKSYIDDASAKEGAGYYPVSASRHNADNHCIASHKSGKVFRGSDGGMFMHDPEISGKVNGISQGDWVNIASNMGEMLFYNIRTNEFGDQAFIGNTQDIDVQTYRYGRWGHWRGYEGCEASFNPYTGTGYFSGGGGDGPEGMNPDSWHTARNYADVVTGSWFMLRTWSGDNTRSTLFRVDDIGRSLTDLYPAIGQRVTDVGLARKDGLTVFIKTADNAYHVSTDSCKTFKALYTNTGVQAKFSNTHLAVNPDDPSVFYIGQNNGKVWKYHVKEGTYEPVGTGLPTKINCSRLLFHEGSGDLYYADYSSGIYILKNGESEWKFWTKGYNSPGFNDCDINYTTQEMVISDYGRGVWVADLETPSDRYFKNDFPIKELSHRDGKRTFGIDTNWTIPMYYDFTWILNDNPVQNGNYQYLTVDDTEEIKSVQLLLSLREAPDVKTASKKIEPTGKSINTPIKRHQGNALYSNGMGRVDIGYMDWFDGDFSVDLWVKPQSDGVIMANTQKNVEKGAKGWVLYIEGGVLKFKYYPSNLIQQPTYEATINQNPVVTGGAVTMNKWSHVAVTQERHGDIRLYINGQQTASSLRVRADERHGLNNSVIMSLFGDAFESNCLNGAIDELKVWKKALSQTDVQREMFSTGLNTSGLVAHYDFNGDQLADNRETFTGHVPVSRTRARTEAQRMTVPVNADFVDDKPLNGKTEFSGKGSLPLVSIDAGKSLDGVNSVVYGYDAQRWNNPDDNLSEDYYEPADYGYMIRMFGAADLSSGITADVTFHNGQNGFDPNKSYRLYVADNSADRMYWKKFDGTPVHDGNKLKLTGVKVADIVDRKLMLVSMKPAIEMEIKDLSNDGKIVLYDDGEDKTKFDFTARLIENKTLTGNRYEIMSDSAVLIVPEIPLTFDNNKEAFGKIEVDTDLIGDFNNTISTYIRGKHDNDMIPIPIDILNRISPKTLNNSVKISKGGLKVGTSADFASLKGSRNLTVMGWVRIDDTNVMNTGRNGDGVTPLIFFRSTDNSGTTGIHLRRHTTDNAYDGGELGYHWNDKDWNYNAKSGLVIPKDAVGDWFHVALVVKPEGAWLYLNGMEKKMDGIPSTGMPECTVQSPLLLGMNIQGGNTYFSGAFDHVAVWDRSLSKEEIHKYMQNRVLLNDDRLIAYMTMDETDSAGRFKESVSGMTAANVGTVTTGDATPVPFAPFSYNIPLGDSRCPFVVSDGSVKNAYISTFQGNPYNYVPAGTEEQQYVPLNHYYYTLVYDALPATSGNVTLTYVNEGLVDGEEVALGIRELGATVPFAKFVKAEPVSNNRAVFTLPAKDLGMSSELMLFSTPNDVHRPSIVHMSFHNPDVQQDGIYLLSNTEDEISVDLKVVSGNDDVRIVPTQSYVTANESSVDMNRASQTVVLKIDKNQLRSLDKFGLHDVTLNLAGATSKPLNVKVGLKPRVELKLKNGDDATHFTAREAVSTLDIEAELTEGYLDKEMKLRLSPESLQSAFSINNGSLLLNKPVTISGLNYSSAEETSQTDRYNGWNIIGNPFLTDINLTKRQNYDFAQQQMTHFVYHTISGSDNIIAFDMTEYDGNEHIVPFQSYYVQTMLPDADFTVTEVAKERILSRKTFDYYSATEVKGLTLKLLDDSGREIDRTTVRWSDDADYDFLRDEDAKKIHSVNGMDNELYTYSGDLEETSINFIPDEEKEQVIAVGLEVKKPGTMKLQVSRLTGFNTNEEDSGDRLYLYDDDTPRLLTPDDIIEFDADEPGNLFGRFHLVRVYGNNLPTDVDGVMTEKPDYRVYTDKGSIRITGLRGNAVINVYDTSGMIVIGQHTDMPEFTSAIAAGIYVVRIRENNKDFVTKIIVN